MSTVKELATLHPDVNTNDIFTAYSAGSLAVVGRDVITNNILMPITSHGKATSKV